MITDAVGNEIYPGADVVYNLSGELAYGRVEKVTEKLPRLKNMNHIVTIRYFDGPFRHAKGKHLSKVENTNCIMVIG